MPRQWVDYHASEDEKDDGARNWEQHHSWQRIWQHPATPAIFTESILKTSGQFYCLRRPSAYLHHLTILQLIIAVDKYHGVS